MSDLALKVGSEIASFVLGTISGPIVGFVLGVVGTLIAQRLQSSRAARLEHLALIKSQVFTPLRTDIKEFYIPILSTNLGPVVLELADRKALTSLRDGEAPRELNLAPRRTTQRNQFPLYLDRDEPPALNSQLYLDVRANHYQHLVRSFDDFLADVSDYQAWCVRYAGEVSRRIAKTVALRRLTRDSLPVDTNWVNTDRLAIFVLDWQLGISTQRPYTGPTGKDITIDGSWWASAQDQAAISQTLQVIDELIKDRSSLPTMQAGRAQLLGQANSILAELDRLLVSARLPERCPLTKTSGKTSKPV